MLGLFQALSNPMSEQPKVQQSFTGSVYGVAGNVEGDQIINAPEKQQTLAEAAAEIQRLLKQLEETNPTATEREQEAYISAAVAAPVRKRLVSAVTAGGKAAIEEFLDNPYLNVAMAAIEGWKTGE